MTPTKHRALIALADATDRPFLSAAPLMAIVEAVAVLDEAGLLGEGSAWPKRGPLRDDCPNNCDRGVIGVDGPGPDESRDYPCPHCEPQGETIRLLRAKLADAERRTAEVELQAAALRELVTEIRDSNASAIESAVGWGTREMHEARVAACDEVLALVQPPKSPCPKCGESLNGGQTCLNFPACPDAIMPF